MLGRVGADTENIMQLQSFILLRQPAKVNDMYKRNLKLNIDNRNLTGIDNMLGRYGNFSELGLITEASGIIKIGTETTGAIQVANGWNADRLSFIMKVLVKNKSQSKNTYYFLTGYTDSYDASVNDIITNLNYLDPKMRFNINSISAVEEFFTSVDGQPRYTVKEEISIVKNGGNMYDNMLNDEYLIRPVDILSALQDSSLGTNMSHEATEVNKTNVNPITFMGNLITSIRDGKVLSNEDRYTADTDGVNEFKISQDIPNMTSLAQQNEANMMSCPFLLALYQATIGNYDADVMSAKPAHFSISDLYKIFTAEAVNYVSQLHLYKTEQREAGKRNLYNHFNFDTEMLATELSDTLQPTIENLIALEFYYMVSSYLFYKKITYALMTLSNHSEFVVGDIATIHDSGSYFGAIFNAPEKISQIDVYLKQIVLPKLTQKYTNRLGGRSEFNLHLMADMDLLGKTTIYVKVEGGRPVIFRYNASMDNKFAPLVTTKNVFDNTLSEVANMIDYIK